MIYIDGPNFKDDQGRWTSLRGVNLSGASKLPSKPYLPTHKLEGFFESEQTVSFIDRPFPLDEADEHLSRLKLWGFNFIRLNVSWEALEHQGPGQYDYEFMDYLVKVLIKMKSHGFRCFIDPHQDVWSRFCGGSGAPGWTLRLAGFDPMNFNATGAAIVQNTFHDPSNYPKMIWATNYSKLACSTMFTLFFGGETFAPITKVGVVNIQEFLQNHYIQSFVELIKRISLIDGLLDDVVVGYDTLNEPHHGFIGIDDITDINIPSIDLKLGNMPSSFQSILLGSGHSQLVSHWQFTSFGPSIKGTFEIDPKGISAWSNESYSKTYDFKPANKGCLWANNGLWDPSTKKCLFPNYFKTNPVTKKPVDFMNDFWLPFIEKFTESIRKVHLNAIIFIEPPVLEKPPNMELFTMNKRFCYAPHWYDGLTLITKSFNPWMAVDYLSVKRGHISAFWKAIWFGEKGIKGCIRNQLLILKNDAKENLGNIPCLIGEIGIPFDMDSKTSYKTGNYDQQIKAFDANLFGLERNLLNFTLWNYCPDNNHVWGDNWNGEDLSIFSRFKRTISLFIDPLKQIKTNLKDINVNGLNEVKDNKESSVNGSNSSQEDTLIPTSKDMGSIDMKMGSVDLNLGGRALNSIVRPYPLHVSGIPTHFSFDMKTTQMTFGYTHSKTQSSRTTELFLPNQHYPTESMILIKHDDKDANVLINIVNQRIIYKCGCEPGVYKQHFIVVKHTLKKGGVLFEKGLRKRNNKICCQIL